MPHVMSVEMEEISHITESLTIDDLEEELQEMIGPSVTPTSSDDEEEVEIYHSEEDLIDQGILFDPDWPPGEDIHQWAVPGPLELVIVNPVGAPPVESD